MKTLTINPDAIIVLKDKAGNFVFSKEAEIELQKLVDLQNLLEEYMQYVKDTIGNEMDKQHIKKIVGEKLTARKGLYGERYQIDKDITEDKFTKEVTYIKANSDEITKFYEEKGELPKGVSLKARSEKVSITSNEKQIED